MGQQIRYVQKKMRRSLTLVQLKWDFLETQIWNKQYNKLGWVLGAGHKLWEEKIKKTSPPTKSFVLQTYFNRQLLDGKVRFMKWYLKDQEMRIRY